MRVTKVKRRQKPAPINIPALNSVRREYLLNLARKYEEEAEQLTRRLTDKTERRLYNKTELDYRTLRRRQCLGMAHCYRGMAEAAFKADDPAALSERDKLAAKLRAMTVANGCTEAEAETAQMMLFRLEAEEAVPCA
jgi:ATP/maltotriose-dependent transcriptional regulator MalT